MRNFRTVAACWTVSKGVGSGPDENLLGVYVETKDGLAPDNGDSEPGKKLGPVVLILYPKSDYNSTYFVTFHAEELPAGKKARIVDLVSSPVHWGSTGEGTIKSSLVPKATSLITLANVGGKIQHPSVNAVEAAFDFTFDRLPKAVQYQNSYYQLHLTGNASTYELDKASKVNLDFSGVTDWYQWGAGPVAIAGIHFDTSQSWRQQTGYYEFGWRIGDRRYDYNGCVPQGSVLGWVYGEAAIQVGGDNVSSITGVPAARHGSEFIVRPRIRLGLNGFPPETKCPLKLTGYFDVYGVSAEHGGSDDPATGTTVNTGWQGVFDATATLTIGSFAVSLAVAGGTNPSQGFVNVGTTYMLTVSTKF
jgi:hypothetical protein